MACSWRRLAWLRGGSCPTYRGALASEATGASALGLSTAHLLMKAAGFSPKVATCIRRKKLWLLKAAVSKLDNLRLGDWGFLGILEVVPSLETPGLKDCAHEPATCMRCRAL